MEDLRTELGLEDRSTSHEKEPTSSMSLKPRGSAARSRPTCGSLSPMSPGAGARFSLLGGTNSSLRSSSSPGMMSGAGAAPSPGGGGLGIFDEVFEQQQENLSVDPTTRSGPSSRRTAVEPPKEAGALTISDIMAGVEQHGQDRAVDAAMMGLNVGPTGTSSRDANASDASGPQDFKSIFAPRKSRVAGMHRQESDANFLDTPEGKKAQQDAARIMGREQTVDLVGGDAKTPWVAKAGTQTKTDMDKRVVKTDWGARTKAGKVLRVAKTLEEDMGFADRRSQGRTIVKHGFCGPPISG